MRHFVQGMRPVMALGNAGLNGDLNTVVSQWSMLAEQGKDTLQSVSGRLYIENPYVPGNPLELGDPLFVGRNDIVQKLGQALQQKHRPTFLLTCERRMGKSSILKQLFSWFRSIIQIRSHLALLFSGAKMVGDMGRSWAGYFVNVERIKVSFLHATDARNLIVLPIPHIFDDEVVEKIMRITHRHPFLIQAMCKHIIEILNDDSRDRATVEDVSVATQEVFESWAVYFWDLWDRSDQDQRIILQSLPAIQAATVDQMVERSGLNEQRVFLSLEKLQIRDLVLREGSVYQIAIPLFAQWIEQNSGIAI